MTVDAIAAFRATVPQVSLRYQLRTAKLAGTCGFVVMVTPEAAASRMLRIPGVPRTHMPGHPQEQAKGKSVCLADFADAPFVCLAGTRGFRGVCDELCLKAGVAPNVVVSSRTAPTSCASSSRWGLAWDFGLNAAGCAGGDGRGAGADRGSRVRTQYVVETAKAPARPKPPSSTRSCWSS